MWEAYALLRLMCSMYLPRSEWTGKSWGNFSENLRWTEAEFPKSFHQSQKLQSETHPKAVPNCVERVEGSPASKNYCGLSQKLRTPSRGRLQWIWSVFALSSARELVDGVWTCFKKRVAMQMWLIEEMLVASKFIGDECKEYEILILTGFERNSVLSVCLVAWRQAAQAESRECSVKCWKYAKSCRGGVWPSVCALSFWQVSIKEAEEAAQTEGNMGTCICLCSDRACGNTRSDRQSWRQYERLWQSKRCRRTSWDARYLWAPWSASQKHFHSSGSQDFNQFKSKADKQMLVSRPENLKRLTADLHSFHISANWWVEMIIRQPEIGWRCNFWVTLSSCQLPGFDTSDVTGKRHVNVKSMSKLIGILVSQFCKLMNYHQIISNPVSTFRLEKGKLWKTVSRVNSVVRGREKGQLLGAMLALWRSATKARKWYEASDYGGAFA